MSSIIGNGAGDDEEDDYMSMAIAEPKQSVKETSIQRAARKKKQARERSFQKTKQEREADDAAAREAALATSLDASNKGFRMMAKLGYKPGTALGKAEDALTEPIIVIIKDNRGGIGLDTEKKRKIREDFDEAAKRTKFDEGEFRVHVRLQRELDRLVALIASAQKVAEQLDTEANEGGSSNEEDHAATPPAVKVPLNKRPLKSINVLWRGLVKHRLEKEAERRMRANMQQSLSRLPTYDDPDEDEEDKRAYAKKKTDNEFVEEDIYDDDAELNAFEGLNAVERLEKVVLYLRNTYNYCFWCKFRYDDAEMEGCPGTTEEEHD